MKKILNYIRESKGEMKHVNWPTKNQTIVYTALVIALSVVVAFYLGFFDLVFTKILSSISN